MGSKLALDATSNDYIGFTTTPSASQSNTGFSWYGNLLFWKSAEGVVSSKFYAEPTGINGIWRIQWLTNNTSPGNSVAIAFKREAPGNLAKVT